MSWWHLVLHPLTEPRPALCQDTGEQMTFPTAKNLNPSPTPSPEPLHSPSAPCAYKRSQNIATISHGSPMAWLI